MQGDITMDVGDAHKVGRIPTGGIIPHILPENITILNCTGIKLRLDMTYTNHEVIMSIHIVPDKEEDDATEPK